MAEYIDRDELMQKMLAKLRDWRQGQTDFNSFVAGYAQGCIDVENAPTADVAEVKHGEWKDDCVAFYEGATNGYTCSSCGNFVSEETFDLIDFDSDFCGNCGAKMDGKGGE